MRCYLNLLVPVMAVVAGVACNAALAQTPTYNLGRTPTQEELRAGDITAGPDGKGLPAGNGTAKQGATLYAQRCAQCHGPTATETLRSGGRSPLAGGQGTLNSLHPVMTIGSYWPFATTIWDFINRAMPLFEEGSLSADEVYALTAFLLYRNGVIQESDVIDAKSLPKVRMPNRNGFVPPRWQDIPLHCRLGSCP